MKRFIPGFLLLLLLLPAPSPVTACSCVYQSPTEVLHEMDVVFVGVVLRYETIEPSDAPPYKEIEFQAFKYWKGQLEPLRTVATGSAGASCDLNFERGREYLVYAKWNDYFGELSTFLCWRTQPVEAADEDLAELGTPDLVPAAPATWGRIKALYSREP